MTVGKQLTLIFGVLLVLVLGLGYSSLTALGGLEAVFHETTEKTFRKTNLSDSITTAAANMMAAQRGMMLSTALKNHAGAEESKRQFHANVDLVSDTIQNFRPLMYTAQARELVDRIEAGVNSWNNLFPEMERLCQSGKVDRAEKISIELAAPIHAELTAAATQLARRQIERVKNDRQSGARVASLGRWAAFVLIALCILTGGGVVLVVRRLNRQLQRLAEELGEGSDQLTAAAAQVSSSSQTLAQGASEQAASLEETSASSEEISSMALRNADSTAVAAGNMVEAAKRIESANQSLGQMVTSMNEINSSSGKISQIIKVINEIAFQTNILALNAAVEAARAGEAGAGFAVVADEVRNLAQRCAQAARDTAGLIDESITKSSEGKTQLERVAADVRSITESASQAKSLVDEVNHASHEQAQGVSEVTHAIAQMQQVTQQQAATAEESASAGAELTAQSEKLGNIVKSLQDLVGVA